uniref:Uncharacterized protein n=1 Tax=Rhizophora mucronata TaxID=61149 RepID=A0A2P2PZL4_RHIMU
MFSPIISHCAQVRNQTGQ